MPATMKNTKMSMSKSYKSEALGREILWKINGIGQKTYKLKKDVNDVCGIIMRKPGALSSSRAAKRSCGKRRPTIFLSSGKKSLRRNMK